MAKSTYLLKVLERKYSMPRRMTILHRRLSQGKVNRACHSSAMQPAIGVDTDRLTGELLEIAWLLNGLEEREKTWSCQCLGPAEGSCRDYTANTHGVAEA